MKQNNILVVVSDGELLRSAVSILEAAGHCVFGFSHPHQALAHLSQMRPDAVVADMSSETIRSSDLAHYLENHTAVAFVALTHTEEAWETPVGVAPYDYVTKPLAGSGLARSVARAIAHRELVDEISQLRAALDAKAAEMKEAFQIPALPEAGVSLKDVERELLTRALEKFRGNQTRTARYLNISRRTLIYRIGKYNLKGLPAARLAVS